MMICIKTVKNTLLLIVVKFKFDTIVKFYEYVNNHENLQKHR